MAGRPRADNTPRFRRGRDHVESWFLRANHPHEPRALWLKATIFSEAGRGAVAEVWCSLFDATGRGAAAAKARVPIEGASFHGEPLKIYAAGASFDLDPDGGGGLGAVGEFSWDLRWRRVPGPLGEPLCLLPSRRLVDLPLPKNKLLTPAPVLRFEGTVRWGGDTWAVSDWLGMQGHNWGPAHSPEYAWGQCTFTDGDGAPLCSVEGASGRLVVAGHQTPLISLLTVRRGERTYRFDRLVDLWRQDARVDFPRWRLKMRGRAGEALLTMTADPARMVCLGYRNPRGPLSYCLNSKLATASLRVNPTNEDAFECYSAHGGALEFLQPTPVAGLSEVV